MDRFDRSPVTRLALTAAFSILAFSPALALEFPKLGVPNLFGGESKGGAPAAPGATPDCPDIFVDPGQAQIRNPAEADAASVRYQVSIGETARECVIEGDRLTIKVGVEGAAMLGPLGQPGSYGGNLRVAIRDKNKDAIITSKTYHVGATIAAGANRSPYTLIADPVVVPVVSPKAQNDYEILVGFTQGASEKAETSEPRRPRKKKRRR